MRFVVAVVLVCLVAGVGGCGHVGYYMQSVGGHLDLLSRQEPIDELVANPQTPEALRERLMTLLEVRRFAIEELGLPDNGSYRAYVDLNRRYVVWSVFAAPEFSLAPETWCFPFAGCVAYRGYFSEAQAREFAAQLAADGLDVYVGGVPAYSTLGFLSDPVLNTMLASDDGYLAGLIFHELAHQRLYIKDDSSFNEAFASLVEEEGVRRWLSARGDHDAWETWITRRARRRQFNELVAETMGRLDALYQSETPPQQKRGRKAEISNEMRAAYRALREQWSGASPYRTWFRGPLNNAQLASVATYSELVPAFRTLLQQAGGDLEAFYRRVAEIGQLPAEERRRQMAQLSQESAIGDGQDGLSVSAR